MMRQSSLVHVKSVAQLLNDLFLFQLFSHSMSMMSLRLSIAIFSLISMIFIVFQHKNITRVEDQLHKKVSWFGGNNLSARFSEKFLTV